MTNQELYDLIDRFERSSVYTLKLSSGDFSLELGRMATTVPVPQATAPSAVAPEAPLTAEDKNAILAPLVGTYYAAPSPDATPFVSVGDQVKKGQTVCLIEAMKMISEIPAPCDCIITGILKDNGTLAAFQEPLFRYRPC